MVAVAFWVVSTRLPSTKGLSPKYWKDIVGRRVRAVVALSLSFVTVSVAKPLKSRRLVKAARRAVESLNTCLLNGCHFSHC